MFQRSAHLMRLMGHITLREEQGTVGRVSIVDSEIPLLDNDDYQAFSGGRLPRLGVGFTLVKAAHAKGNGAAALVAMAVLSVVVSWAVVHTVFIMAMTINVVAGLLK